MDISQTDGPGTAQLKLSGDLDMHSSPVLRKALIDLVARKVAHIVVSLEGVPYIDSSGLATLVECMQGTSQYKGRLQLTGVNERIRPVFELARLEKFFDIAG